jgi:serine/threonine-protein kinase
MELGEAYTITRELSGGGMSRVFLATDNKLGRAVVVKTLAREMAQGLSAERFEREIRLAARLQEPHIVPVISAGLANGVPYYTMPFVEGESLRARLTLGVLPIPEALGILRDIATALEYAHAHDVVHRDIKPENVLLSGRTAMVADFGIAKALTAAKGIQTAAATDSSLTVSGTTVGTPAYIAPEQAVGAAADHRSDIYS